MKYAIILMAFLWVAFYFNPFGTNGFTTFDSYKYALSLSAQNPFAIISSLLHSVAGEKALFFISPVAALLASICVLFTFKDNKRIAILSSLLFLISPYLLSTSVLGIFEPKAFSIFFLALSLLLLSKEESIYHIAGGFSILISYLASSSPVPIIFALLYALWKHNLNSILFAAPTLLSLIRVLPNIEPPTLINAFSNGAFFFVVIIASLVIFGIKLKNKKLDLTSFSSIFSLLMPFDPIYSTVFLAFATYSVFDYVSNLKGDKISLSVLGGVTAFSITYLLVSSSLDLVKTILLSLFVAALPAVYLHVSKVNYAKYFKHTAYFAMGLLFFSTLFNAGLVAPVYKGILSPEMIDALNWLSPHESTVYSDDKTCALILYYTKNKCFTNNFNETMFSKAEIPASDYLVVSADLFDSSPIESFRFAGFAPVENTLYGYFISQGGLRLYFNAGPDGNSVSENWIIESIQTGEGRTIAYDALPIVRDKSGMMYRIVYPLQTSDINIFKLFFGYVGEWKQIYPTNEGALRIFTSKSN